jgi:hypothetical protein
MRNPSACDTYGRGLAAEIVEAVSDNEAWLLACEEVLMGSRPPEALGRVLLVAAEAVYLTMVEARTPQSGAV